MLNSREILNGYREAALWCGLREEDEEYAHAYPLSPETLAQMSKDCVMFEIEAGEGLEDVGLHENQIGHDFWLTRNGHGCGFWDRGLGEPCDDLTRVAHEFGECSLEVNHETCQIEIM